MNTHTETTVPETPASETHECPICHEQSYYRTETGWTCDNGCVTVTFG